MKGRCPMTEMDPNAVLKEFAEQVAEEFPDLRQILDEAKAVGANAIAVACPLCHANIDMRQGEIEAKYEKDYKIPVFYFTQLLGLAMGLAASDVAVNKHLVGTEELIGAGARNGGPKP